VGIAPQRKHVLGFAGILKPSHLARQTLPHFSQESLYRRRDDGLERSNNSTGGANTSNHRIGWKTQILPDARQNSLAYLITINRSGLRSVGIEPPTEDFT